MFPSDYLVGTEVLALWQSEFQRIAGELRYLADEIAQAEAGERHTCPGPFASLALRGAHACEEFALCFRIVEQSREAPAVA